MSGDFAIVLIALSGIIIFQMIIINQLTSKVMSRNYHDYEFAKNVKKTMDSTTAPPSLQEELQHNQDLREDLSPVENFM